MVQTEGGVLGLLGPVVGWGSILVAAAAFLVGLLAVPRVIRRGDRVGWGGRLAQALALLLCALLAMLATGVWLNRSFVFFGSWADVFDGGGTNLTAQRFGAAQDQSAPALSSTAAATLRAATAAPVSRAQSDPLHDRALAGAVDEAEGQYVPVRIPGHGTRGDALVHLPAGYMRHPHQRYPVLLAFPGVPGSPRTWRQAFHLGETLDRLAASGSIRPTIVVILDTSPGRHDTECVDPSPAGTPGVTAGGHDYETWISDDVSAWLRKHLRTVQDPNAWATIGYSAGGWCATMISVRHPDLARTSVSLAGYFRPDYDPKQVWTPADDPRYDLEATLRRERPPVRMYFFAGGEDELARPTIGPMERAVAAPSALTVLHTRHGGHLITLWIAHLPASLTWLSTNAAGFSPQGE